MRNYINLFFVLLVFLSACSKNKLPPGILNADDMTGVLTDVHLVDGSMYALSPAPDTLYKYGLNRYLRVFRQHHTDSLQFRKSLEYYSRRPDQMSDIYTQVLKNLQDQLDELNKSNSPKNALPAK